MVRYVHHLMIAVIPRHEGSARLLFYYQQIPPYRQAGFAIAQDDSYNSSFKNFQAGLSVFINSSFLLLLHPFSSFSLAIASSTC
jgi:hypothetical protein